MEYTSVQQWGPFLSFFSRELTSNLTPRLLMQLMRNTGGHFARQYVLGPVGTVADMQSAMNRIWKEMGWGEVDITEDPDRLLLTHHRAPLDAAFGEENQAWSSAFLEGAYETWMHQLGADTRLHMSAVGATDTSGIRVFRFGI